MIEKSDKIVPLREIAAYVNNPDADPEILAFEGRINPKDVGTDPLRIDALMMMLFTEGSGKISVDLKEYEVGVDSMMILNPHNYISIRDCTPDVSGKVLFISHKAVENILPKLTDLLPVIVYNRNMPVRRLNADEVEWMSGIFRLIRSKLEGKPTKFMMPKLYGILQAALYEIMDINIAGQANDKTMRSRKEELMAKFILAVMEDCTRHRKVEYYADRLCITPKHLSAVVKEISGMTAGKLIDNYVVLEAKMLLKNTDLTIQEIAARLNFPNQSFFGKYFKHSTGLSPSEFRAEN